MVTNESSIELRIKVIDDNRTFPDWSSSIIISRAPHSINDVLVLTDEKGASSLKVFVGVEINRWSKGDFLLDQVKREKNAAACTIFVYVPTILVDYTGQNLEFMNSSSILKQGDNSLLASQICGSLRQANLSRQGDKNADSDGVLYLIGGKTNALAIRQFSHQTTSSWSRAVLLGTRKSHYRIDVPRLSSQSTALVLCATKHNAPNIFGGKLTNGKRYIGCWLNLIKFVLTFLFPCQL